MPWNPFIRDRFHGKCQECPKNSVRRPSNPVSPSGDHFKRRNCPMGSESRRFHGPSSTINPPSLLACPVARHKDRRRKGRKKENKDCRPSERTPRRRIVKERKQRAAEGGVVAAILKGNAILGRRGKGCLLNLPVKGMELIPRDVSAFVRENFKGR